MLVTAGAFAGGFVTGLAGFGTGLVALGIWLQVIDPAPASTLVAICSVAAQGQGIHTVWYAIAARLDKDERRGVFQAFNFPVLAAVVGMHAASGLLTAELGRLLLCALPGTLIGSFLGARAYRGLSEQGFHEVVPCLLGLSGLVLIWNAL